MPGARHGDRLSGGLVVELPGSAAHLQQVIVGRQSARLVRVAVTAAVPVLVAAGGASTAPTANMGLPGRAGQIHAGLLA